ncbi:MAG: FHA domain-containing protein [Muribaculaceae bacterium]
MRTYFAPASGHNTDSQTRVSQNAPVTLVLESGRRIPIFPGEHILGRDSSDSGAEIHVAPDIYMSRSHARLSVAVGPDNSVQCSLTPLESANSIVVNSRALRTGEQTTLANGDRVLLGITGFTVEII